jgi:NAD-dependent deacetylase
MTTDRSVDAFTAETAAARRLLAGAGCITVLTGAGISTDSGIPDFRGPQGVWTKNPAAEKAATLQNYLSDPDVRRSAWQNRLLSPTWNAQPNAGHRALVDLDHDGRLDTLVTQNVDGLHQAAGSDAEKVVEVHGTIHRARCWQCGEEGPIDVFLDRVRAGDPDPDCLLCGGIVKSATISFGQSLVPEDIDRAFDAAQRCDVLLAIGSTLAVYPVAKMVPIAASHGAPIVIVNAAETEMDDIATFVLRGQIGDILPVLAGRR